MTVVRVEPGPCGFTAQIKAKSEDRYTASLTIESECPAVIALNQELATLDMEDIIGRKGFGGSRPFEIAANHLPHSSCPVLSAVLKAAEVELGLALSRTVTIEFIKEDEQ